MGWVGFLPPVSAAPGGFVTYSAATNTFTVLPNSVDDTANIQTAFDSCAATGAECTVELSGGVFHTAQVVVYDFQGTFRGMGQYQTTVEALPDLPVGEFVTRPPSAENPWPSLFTFFDGTYMITDITFTEPWATPLHEWNVCEGCYPTTALFAVISVTGLHANAIVDHVTMVGAPGDWVSYGGIISFNVINGIFPQALVLGHGKKDFSRVIPMQVRFELTNSAFFMIDNPSGAENLEDSVYIARFNTLDTVEYGLWFVNVGNSIIDLSHNVLRNVIAGSAIIAYQNRPINVLMPCQPHTDIFIAHNELQFTNLANGIILVDYADRYGCEKSLDGVISGNTFYSDETSFEAVLAFMMGSVVVSGNAMIGATYTGVAVWNGRAVISHNGIRGAQVGVWLDGATGAAVEQNDIEDSLYLGIFLTGGSSNNLVSRNEVRNSGLVDLAWDMTGAGNIWTRNECRTSDPPGLCAAG